MKNENCYTVYMHIFPNDKKYIGITSQRPTDRWRCGSGYKHSLKIRNAIEKYGWKNVKHEILHENLSQYQAEEIEIKLIKKYKTTLKEFGYNISHGGNCVGTLSEETKLKMSLSAKGRVVTEATKEKLRQANLGKKQSQETINKRAAKLRGGKRPTVAKIMSERVGEKNPLYGTKLSEERKEIQRQAIVKRWENGFTGNRRPVLQFSRDGNFICEYESATEAVIKNNFKSNQISECCRNKRKTSNNFIWKYKGE